MEKRMAVCDYCFTVQEIKNQFEVSDKSFNVCEKCSQDLIKVTAKLAEIVGVKIEVTETANKELN